MGGRLDVPSSFSVKLSERDIVQIYRRQNRCRIHCLKLFSLSLFDLRGSLLISVFIIFFFLITLIDIVFTSKGYKKLQICFIITYKIKRQVSTEIGWN
jgi:hypothetical protein